MMTDRVRKILTVVLAAVFVVSTALFIGRSINSAEAADSYQAAEEIAARPRQTEASELAQPEAEATAPPEPVATEPPIEWVVAPVEEDEHMKKLKDINLEALREKNPDVVGWVFAPNCRINYPVVQGEDNQYYLNHTWDHRTSVAGSIFMEATNSPDFSDFRTILYGHNMADMSMFGALHRYESQVSRSRNPYVYLVTDEGVLRYEIYSVYKADVESNTYALNLEDEARRASFIKLTKEESMYEIDITPAVTDRILTLSTCAGGASTRRVVHARLPMVQAETKTDSPQG